MRASNFFIKIGFYCSFMEDRLSQGDQRLCALLAQAPRSLAFSVQFQAGVTAPSYYECVRWTWLYTRICISLSTESETHIDSQTHSPQLANKLDRRKWGHRGAGGGDRPNLRKLCFREGGCLATTT